MKKLPESGQLILTEADFNALVKKHNHLANAMLQEYARHATRVELVNGDYVIDYTLIPKA